MRLLVGLVLGFALLAQPAAAGDKAKPEKPEKKDRQERRLELREVAPEPLIVEPAAPTPTPVPVDVPAVVAAVAAALPVATATPTPPSPVATPTPTPVPTAAAPATAAAPKPSKRRPARRARRGRRPQPRAAVPAPVATVPPATVRPAPTPRTRRAPARPRRDRAGVPRDATVPAAVGTAAVTRVIRVIPPPLRYALGLLILLAGLLAFRARGLERQRDTLSDDVGLLQSALLPALPPRVGQALVSAAYQPAEGLAAGGDFYDAFALDGQRTCLLVGDVAGHGRDAIPLTADVRFTLRAYVEAGMSPRAALKATAAVIEPRLGGRFVTVVVAVYDARSGRLTYATAGHPPPALLGTDETLVTASACPALGTGLPCGLRETSVPLPPGAGAVFHTDGLSDVVVGNRRLGAAGLDALLRSLGPYAQARDLLDRIVRESDSQPDDMAAVVLRPLLGAATAGPGRIEELEVQHPQDRRARRLLLACGVPDEEAERALAAARDLAPVVIEITCGPGGPTVAVRRPDAQPVTASG
jgi:hypothetical protein